MTEQFTSINGRMMCRCGSQANYMAGFGWYCQRSSHCPALYILSLERDGAKLQGLNQQLAARVAELEKQQEAGKAPACHHHRITPECPECDKGKAPARECPTQKALEEIAANQCGFVPNCPKALARKFWCAGCIARAALSAPCPCDSLRARFQESSEEYRKGLDALRAENESLRAKVETLETDLAEAKLMLGAISECTNGNEWVEWNQRADELRAVALKEGK